MMNWNGFSNFLSRFLKLAGALIFFTFISCKAQSVKSSSHPHSTVNSQLKADSTKPQKKFPDPHKVLFKSLMIPGWGQVINKQIYKVPIIYALLGGLTGYSIYLTKKYHDYRAAYYNRNGQTPNDNRFGPTPAYLKNVNLSSLKRARNAIHNRRDFIYITIAMAYGLNAIDAYVFAQLRPFNVSKNLSMRASLKPGLLAQSTPGITLSLNLFGNTK